MEFETPILIVDDNATTIAEIGAILKKLKIRYDEAYNGLHAYDKVINKGKTNYKIILMDTNMPILNGFESAIKINEELSKSGEKANIIAVAAVSDDRLKEVVKNAGMKEYIVKPITQEDIMILLKKYAHSIFVSLRSKPKM
jgi:two-component system, sensor histidine kinase